MVYSLLWLHADPVTVELLYIKRKLKIEFNKKKLSFVQLPLRFPPRFSDMVLDEKHEGVSII